MCIDMYIGMCRHLSRPVYQVNKCVNGSFTKIRSLVAHTANCYCIDFDPTNRYFATGG